MALVIGLSAGACGSTQAPGNTGDTELRDVPAAMDGQAGAGATEQQGVDPVPVYSAAGDVFEVRVIEAQPAQPERYTNNWLIEVVDSNGTPAPDVDLTFVQPYMPRMRHDGLRDPVVTRLEAPGRFQVDDINLWMPGLWEVRFQLQQGALEDLVAIEFVLGS